MAKKNLTLDEKLNEAIVRDGAYEVPGNWVWSKLGYVIELISGRDVPATQCNNEKRGIPYILGASNIKDGIFIEERWIEKPVVIAKKNDILLSCKGTIGKTIIINKEINISRQIMSIRCKENIEIKYVKFFVDSYVNTLIEQSKGLIPGITRDDVLDIKFPLPPFKEQHRIVDRIESLFEKLDRAKELIEEAREGFEKRKFSTIYKGISGDLTGNNKKMMESNGIRVPIHWEWIKFNVLGKLERGRSKHRPRNDERLFNGKYPFIQTGDIANSNGYIVEHKQTLSEFGLNQSKLFSKDTLCITIAANIGDVAILTYDCCFPDSVVGFTPNENVDSKYIYYFITLIKRDLEHFAPSTAQKNINLKILGDLEIPLPTLEEQKEIVRILDKFLEEETKIEELTQLEEQIELIKKSILAKAFRGELGTNLEEDESALELLKQILI